LSKKNNLTRSDQLFYSLFAPVPSVVAGILPAVEPGILPGGKKTHDASFPGGEDRGEGERKSS
jgi:hypothetical protein